MGVSSYIPRRSATCGIALLVAVLAVACRNPPRCGEGTHEERGACVANIQQRPPEVPAVDAAPPAVDAAPTPTDDSLVTAWEHELIEFGFDRFGNNVNAGENGDSLVGFKKGRARQYTAPSSDIFGKPNGEHWTMKITNTRVEPGDSDTFPYFGTVAWKLSPPAYSPVDGDRIGTTAYQYSAKAQQWRRR